MDFNFKQVCDYVAEATASLLAEKMKSEEKVLPLLLNINQVSELTGYSVRTIYQMSSEGRMVGRKKMGGKLMFERDAILHWIANK